MDKEFIEKPDEAEEYLCDTAQKWENSLAVKINNGVWLVGGWFSS